MKETLILSIDFLPSSKHHLGKKDSISVWLHNDGYETILTSMQEDSPHFLELLKPLQVGCVRFHLSIH